MNTHFNMSCDSDNPFTLVSTNEIDDILKDFVILDSWSEIEINQLGQVLSPNVYTNGYNYSYNLYNANQHTVLFNIEKYLLDIINSYNCNVLKILEQIEVDFPRTNVFVNKVRVLSIDEFVKNIKGTKKTYLLADHHFNFVTILLLLCCQSSYGFPFITLHNLYCADKKNKNLLLCSTNTNRLISFNQHCNELTITIEADYVIKDTAYNTTLNNLSNKIILDIERIVNMEDEKEYVKFNQQGLFFWSIK